MKNQGFIKRKWVNSILSDQQLKIWAKIFSIFYVRVKYIFKKKKLDSFSANT